MTTRVDSWIWAIRLTKTRSAAGAACRGGHVRVNGVTAKPAQPVSVGDEVSVRLHGHDRIVEVTKLISKRVSAPTAAECYIDHSPPPPPKEVLASQPRRDPGAGRPTKRERRDLDRLRMRDGSFLIAMIAVLALVLTGCSGSGDDDPATPKTPEAPGKAGSGPYFGACGGVTNDEVARITTFSGLTNTVNNASACEWSSDADRTGPVTSFNWYRGSPIGRERATEQLSRETTKDIEINGHKGFIASDAGICEIGIAFGADFFEWSVSAGSTAVGTQPPPTDQICDAAKQLSTMSIQRST